MSTKDVGNPRNRLRFLIILCSLLSVPSSYYCFCVSNQDELKAALRDCCNGQDTSQRDRARQTILVADTNCLPLLLSLINQKDDQTKIFLLRLQSLFPPRFHSIHSASEKQEWALNGLAVLGLRAETTVPKLAQFLNDPKLAPVAARGLVSIGPPGIIAFQKALTNENAFIREVAVGGIGTLGTASPARATDFLFLLRDREPEVRSRTALTLGLLGQDSIPVLEGLLQALSDPEPEVRANSALALGTLQINSARVLVQLNRVAVSDVSSEVRKEAAIALTALPKVPPECPLK